MKTNRKKTPNGYRRMLTTANHKTSKGESEGYVTAILYLSPADESGIMDTCGNWTIECKNACLGNKAGRNVMPANKASRLWKTQMLFENRALFMDCLRWDVGKLVRLCAKLGFCPQCKDIQKRRKGAKSNICRTCKGALENAKPAVRTNGSSDLPWIARVLAGEFPVVQFYDYTKHPRPELRILPNYSITFSYSGRNLADAMHAAHHGANVAVVFDTKKGEALPAEWNGFRVTDGDKHDLRFLDEKGVIVGLRVKGKAIKQKSCFIVETKPQLIQIGLAA